MKTLFQFTLLFCLALVFTGCLEEQCESEQTYIVYEPVYLDIADFRKEISKTDARELCNPSGFYVYGDYLLVIEYNDGLHIMDNSNPAAPQAIAYLPVGGAVGLSVRNNILYINNYFDLLTFDLQDPTNPQMLHRTENVFETYGVFNPGGEYNRVVTGYVETPVRQVLDCNSSMGGYPGYFFADERLVARVGLFGGNRVDAAAFVSVHETANNAGGQNETVGVGGSLARFTITNQTLYVVNDRELKAFDLATPSEPAEAGTVTLGWGVETIFPNGDELYIGTTTGMHIMDASDPLNPAWLGSISHVRSCDPVVVSGDKAYVTLLGGGGCGGSSNQLDIVDISDKTAPEIVQTHQMNGPVGLSVGNQKLFICEPGFGMKILELNEEGLLSGESSTLNVYNQARDIIGLHRDQHLITIGTDGVRQLQYNEQSEVEELSLLNICPNL